jgi:hypothetical protein
MPRIRVGASQRTAACNGLRRSKRDDAQVHRAGRYGDPLDRGASRSGVFAYSTNYLIDVDNAIIVDVPSTTAIRQTEIPAVKRRLIWRQRLRLGRGVELAGE